jgi:hypothetical protein
VGLRGADGLLEGVRVRSFAAPWVAQDDNPEKGRWGGLDEGRGELGLFEVEGVVEEAG